MTPWYKHLFQFGQSESRFDLEPRAVLARLSFYFDKDDGLSVPIEGYSKNQYQIKMLNNYGFRISQTTKWRRSNPPKESTIGFIKGMVNKSEDGSRISLAARLPILWIPVALIMLLIALDYGILAVAGVLITLIFFFMKVREATRRDLEKVENEIHKALTTI